MDETYYRSNGYLSTNSNLSNLRAAGINSISGVDYRGNLDVNAVDNRKVEDYLVEKVIEKLTGEGTLNVILETIMSKLSEYMESPDNKELLTDFLEFKLKPIIEKYEEERCNLHIEIDKIKEDIYKLKENLGVTRNGYDNNYYLGSISSRLHDLETKTNRIDGLWNNYLGPIESLLSQNLYKNEG